MLIKSVSKQITLPHEPGTTLTIRKLSFKECETAQVAKQKAALQIAREMGADLMKALQDSSAVAEDQPASQRYDMYEVLCAGITQWSYDEPVTAENVALLDAESARYVFEQIVLLTDGAEPDKAKKR